MNTGQIIKTSGDHPFVMVPTAFIKNPKVSAKAKGLLAFLLSLPPNWVLYKTTLSDYFSDGKDSLNTAWDELSEHGYVVSVRVVGSDGLTKGWNHMVYPEPMKPESSVNTIGSTESGKSAIGESAIGKAATNNIDNTIKKEFKKKHIVKPSSEEELEFEKFRKLYPGTKNGFQVEYQNLIKKHKDYKEIIPSLVAALERMMRWRAGLESRGKFVPEYANLSTWINQRRWEVEYASLSTQPSVTIRRNQTLE